MSTITFREVEWRKLYAFLQSHPRDYTGKEAECRLILEAVLWITRSGTQWRLLPEKYGQWNSVYKRLARWCEHDIWEDMHQHFVADPDMENLNLDSSVIRAHPCAAGAAKKRVAKPGRVQHQDPRERRGAVHLGAIAKKGGNTTHTGIKNVIWRSVSSTKSSIFGASFHALRNWPGAISAF